MVTLYLLLGLVYNTQNPQWNTAQYAQQWKQVEKALADGKPQTAAKYLGELEEMTRANGDELERLEVMRQRYDCLSRYNWKEARDYYSAYSGLRDSVFSSLDTNIEKYCKHPRVIMLIAEKIERLKNEEDGKDDAKQSEDVYKNIRKMCQEAIKAFPKSDHTRRLQALIDDMDARWMNFGGPDRGYPGAEFTYEINTNNIASADFKVYRLSDRYSIGDGEKFAKYDSGSTRCVLVGSKKIDTFKNKYNIWETVETTWKFDEEGLYIVKLVSADKSAYHYVYISRVAVALREVDGKYEVYAADAVSGKPYDKLTVTAYRDGRGKGTFLSPVIFSAKEYAQNGFTPLSQKLYESPENYGYFYVTADGDSFTSPMGVNRPYIRHYEREISQEGVYIYTDRRLYKPSDEIQFKVVAFRSNGKEGEVLEGKKLEVELYAPAESKPVATVKVVTNAYGSASGSFTIPEGSRNGSYSIRTDYGGTSVRVEEYTTPDFYLEMPVLEGLYTFDDIITQTGEVKGYAGIAMAGAKVEYTVRRQPHWRVWRMGNVTGWKTIDEGSVTADADGRFAISFKAERPEAPEDDDDVSASFLVEVKVTDRQGETHEASQSVMVADIPLQLSTAFASEVTVNDTVIAVNRDVEKYILINGTNRNGIPQTVDGSFRLLSDGKVLSEGDFTTGKKRDLDFSSLPSGSYRLEYQVIWRGRTISGNREVALFSPSDTKVPVESKLFFYPIETEGGIEFFVGTTEEDLYIEVELFDRDLKLYRMPLHLKNEARRISLPYLDKYNDCVELSLFTIRDQKQYHETYTFKRPVSPVKFDLQIESFRDRTAPETEESFIVKGPASELTVSIFDVTTDRYGANRFNFSPFQAYYTSSPYISTNLPEGRGRVYGETVVIGYGSTRGGLLRRVSSMNTMAKNEAMVMDDMMVLEEAAVAPMGFDSAAEQEEEGAEQADVRSDFGETIAFYPHITIGDDGKVEVKYTTRQAFGTFRVMVLAHDKNLHSGSAEQKFIVQKELMVMPSLPLFATEGDKITLKSVVANVSGRELKGTAHIAFEDAVTGKKIDLGTKDKKVTLAAGAQSELEWTVTIPAAERIFVTIDVTADGISDGEKNAIEIVPQVQEITETASFILGGPHGRSYYERQLRDRIGAKDAVVRYEEYGTLDAVRAALTAPERPANDNFISWLDVIYVSQARQKIGETVDKDLTDAAVKKIISLQHSDGSFSWFPCMYGSDVLTMLFAEKMSQLDRMGVRPAGLDASVRKAVKYIDSRIASIADNKNWKWTSLIDYFAVRSLYPDIQMPAKVKDAFNKYLTASEKDWQTTSILAKAQLTNTLLRTKGTDFWRSTFDGRIKTLTESLLDHAVVNRTVGCYFPNAVMPFRGLMSTEVYAHAELQELFFKLGEKEMVTALQQWLLLQKHNQAWESNMATADAVFALLTHEAEDLRLGAVYYTYKAPMQQVKEFSNDMSVKRSFWRDGKELAEGDVLHVGDRIEVRYDLWNGENRSFVQVHAMRPACFYPVDERSYGSSYFYKEQTATGTEYYYQLLPEEDTRLTESFYVTQEGVFNKGLVEIESLYAPEYRGHTAGGTFRSE
ncbi:MAG: hypothetical protein IKX60_03850 [Bacteroidales bacterium]|nr:hypothetical protein [Bacteroidales bacterium]